MILWLFLCFLAPTKAPAEPPSAFQPPPAAVPGKETERAIEALKQGKLERAIEEARRALATNERHVPAIIVLAKAYLQLGKLELASAMLDTAAKIDPKNADVPLVRGFVALANDDQAAAIAQFRKATELEPKHASAWNNLGAQLLLTKSYDGALSALESAIALAPSFAKGHLNLGSALRGKKEYQRAEAEYLRALALDGELYEALFDLGILYLDADKFPGLDPIPRLEKAVDYLQQYRTKMGARLPKEDPSAACLSEAHKALERMRKLEERKKKAPPKIEKSG